MRIITGAPAFFESRAGIAIDTAPAPLLPNPPPQYSLMRTMFDGVDAEPVRQRIDGARDALRRAVQKELAVLPVGHRAPRLHRLMAGGLDDEGLVDDDGRVS